MTQEEKQLLIKDLCGRLPYGVYVLVHDTFKHSVVPYENVYLKSSDITSLIDSISLNERYSSEDKRFNRIIKERKDFLEFKPYLRPLSSMTEEEKIELKTITKGAIQTIGLEDIVVTTDKGFDWLNAHHFDYRGLIEKGLALEKVVLDNGQCESALKMWNEPLSLK